MKILRLSCYAFIGLVIGYLIWHFPVQKFLALIAFKKYREAQGANKSDISKIKVFKDYKRDGYVVNVWYKSQPSLRYEYKWLTSRLNATREMYAYNIILNIYDITDTHVEVYNKFTPKYSPL